MLPEAAIGAICAAVIAAMFSLIGLAIAKENKTSEFRQAWIDALRDDFSALIAAIMAIHSAEGLQGEATPDWWKEVRADYVAANTAISRLRLRLNPAEPLSIELIALLKEIESIINSGFGEEPDRVRELEDEILALAARLLKQEWERVKTGEPAFSIAKWSIAAILLTTLLIGCMAAMALFSGLPVG